ncbi:MAG: phosphoglycerate kinase [Coxiella sp. RIFCSPHIGHO2_12_FULL_44_14]|nr:MAG: phosphoglycerate kinase [Coxiella sp. RIFCSPHIGHO2_12_FULL_44_14]
MLGSFYAMTDLDLDDKRVFIREDFNVPIEKGKITSHERIQRAIPTITCALEAGARVMLASHLGRPTEGEYDAEYSLAPVAEALTKLLKQPVPLIEHWLDGVKVAAGDVVLLENVRFNVGEADNNEALSRKMAALCDIFVMDAFATAHRAQASTAGIARYARMSCAGPLLIEELVALSQAFDSPRRPLVAIVGGSKVSTKIHLLDSLLDKVDQLIVGGGIANTFLAACGYNVGNSLYEADWVKKAAALLARAKTKGVQIPLPTDVVVAKTLNADAPTQIKSVTDVSADEAIFDVGPKTQATYPALFDNAKTIVWNGPVGVFEIENFSHGTEALAKAIANSHAYSLAGGGDTLSALEKFGVNEKISYVSTGGGAFLEYLEGQELPALVVLRERRSQ